MTASVNLPPPVSGTVSMVPRAVVKQPSTGAGCCPAGLAESGAAGLALAGCDDACGGVLDAWQPPAAAATNRKPASSRTRGVAVMR
jgi:hypothetical protein